MARGLKNFNENMEDVMKMLTVIERQLDNPDFKRTSSEEELVAKWAGKPEDTLARLHARSESPSKLHPVDKQKAEKLNSRLSAIGAQLRAIYHSILDTRSPAHDTPASVQPAPVQPAPVQRGPVLPTQRAPLVLNITEDDLPRSLGQRFFES